jgi:hypothetical protein
VNTNIALCALGVAALLAGTNSVAAEPPHATTTTEISFDTYCDGLTITVFSWNQAGTQHSGCEVGRTGAGLVGKVKNFVGKDLTIGENPGDLQEPLGEIYLWNIQYPLATGKTWSFYSSSDGINFTFMASGTYTVIGPDRPAIHVGPPSDFRAREIQRRSAGP